MRMNFSFLAVVLCLAVSGCSGPAASGTPPPFKATFSVIELMEGPIAHASEVYWQSVSTVVDANGITENFPQDDATWEAVWSAGVTLAESGNLLMMSPRARDEGKWMTWASDLVDAGVTAAKAAEARNPEQVLEAGEQVYNVCTSCHTAYIEEE